MGETKALGGSRLGSGKKIKTSLHNYNRSTHNLSRGVKTTMAAGVLYPVYTNIGLAGDTFEIDTKALARTIPTQGPLFGTFKLQIDFFSCPVRLYQGILHNNPINIGLNMKNVKFPRIRLVDFWKTLGGETKTNINQLGFSSSCLIKYLGMSGIGVPIGQYQASPTDTQYYRDVNALPVLAYYDIFKNYYANTQEDNAYVISTNAIGLSKAGITGIYEPAALPANITETFNPEEINGALNGEAKNLVKLNSESSFIWRRYWEAPQDGDVQNNFLVIRGQNLSLEAINVRVGKTQDAPTHSIGTLYTMVERGIFKIKYISRQLIVLEPGETSKVNGQPKLVDSDEIYMELSPNSRYEKESDIALVEFPLENIDKMREKVLNFTELGRALTIPNDINILPYSVLTKQDEKTKLPFNKAIMNGLVIKTYQSDIFNNWVNSDWIDGENGIAAITTIDTSEGLNIDSLNLAQKVYNMLNRIAVAGGTYQDWQNAVYTGVELNANETPMYHGSYASEIMFEEVVSTTATNEQALGSLGGRGKLYNPRGGKIKIRCHEASVIMAIASLTPRISYSQGNDWYMTELDNMDDLHKPALDGIGFQDIIGEQIAWWDTQIAQNGTVSVRHKIGKTTAWQNYSTDYDRNYGEFAEDYKRAYMVLDRRYEPKKQIVGNQEIYVGIEDATTYIDPQKFNYAFAYEELAAQNFWLQLQFNITARRMMSARQLPTM